MRKCNGTNDNRFCCSACVSFRPDMINRSSRLKVIMPRTDKETTTIGKEETVEGQRNATTRLSTREKTDEITASFLRREDKRIAEIREKIRIRCYKVLATEEGAKMIEAESHRLRSRREKVKASNKNCAHLRDGESRLRRKLRHTFEIYVDDEDKIDVEEFAGMMKDLCIPLASAREEFRKIDINNDGRIDFKEFRNWYMERNRRRSWFSNPFSKLVMSMRKKGKIMSGRLDRVRAKRALISTALRKAEKDAREKYRRKHRSEFLLTTLARDGISKEIPSESSVEDDTPDDAREGRDIEIVETRPISKTHHVPKRLSSGYSVVEIVFSASTLGIEFDANAIINKVSPSACQAGVRVGDQFWKVNGLEVVSRMDGSSSTDHDRRPPNERVVMAVRNIRSRPLHVTLLRRSSSAQDDESSSKKEDNDDDDVDDSVISTKSQTLPSLSTSPKT